MKKSDRETAVHKIFDFDFVNHVVFL